MAAITENAAAEAEKLGDVELIASEGATDSAAQADQIETLITQKPDALVVLPNEGEALTPVAQKATAAGIPVINVDREFSTPGAYRTLISGDNYGIGWQAGNYFADQLKCKGNVVEIQGIAGISVTEHRSQGFRDAIKRRCQDGIKIVASQPADFVPDKGLSVMENILQAQKNIDAVYTHDDDMAEGVVSAIENANRQDEMFLTGAGGSKAAMERIEAGGLYRATFLYNPSMSASAIRWPALIARRRGLRGAGRARGPEQHPGPGHHGDEGERRRGQGARLLVGRHASTARRRIARRAVAPSREDASMPRPVTLFTGQWADLPIAELAEALRAVGLRRPRAGLLGRPLRRARRAVGPQLRPRAPRAAGGARPRLLGARLAPHRPGRVRPDRRAPPGDPAARRVGRRRPRRASAAARRSG